MNQSVQLVQSLPALLGPSLPAHHPPPPPGDRLGPRDGALGDGLGALGAVGLRRGSAFSVYEPSALQGPDGAQGESGDCGEGESSGECPLYSPRGPRRNRRELNRLETKNLNRYFRSKINEMLRDIKQNSTNPQESQKADQVLELLNKSNKIMFSEIREIIKDPWLQAKLTRCSGMLLKYIHGGKMGMQSKLIMLKYFNKILRAIRNPDGFTCWK